MSSFIIVAAGSRPSMDASPARVIRVILALGGSDWPCRSRAETAHPSTSDRREADTNRKQDSLLAG